LLKEENKDNKDIINMLNQIGEAKIEYGKLFNKVWNSIN